MNKLIIITPCELRQILLDSVKEAFERQRVTTDSSTDASNTRYLTLKEAARYVHLSPQTLYKHTSARTIPFLKPAKKLLFLESELDQWLLQGKKHSRSQMRSVITGGK